MDAETPPLPPAPRSFNLRKTGLVVGASVFLLGVGVVGLLIAFGGSKPTQPPTVSNKDKLAGGSDPAPSTVDLGGATGININELKNAKVQFVDRNDPTRVMAMLQWSRLEPIDANRASVIDPVAYYYLKTGALVQIKAAKGRIYTPPKQTEPESGTFDGGVTMSLFEPDANNKIDITKDRPAGTLTTNTINFDVGMGELAAPGLVKITSEPIQAQGKGVRLLFNQVAQQLELLQVEEQGQITILPDKARKRRDEQRPTADGPGPDGVTSTVAKVITYRSVFDETVVIEQGPRSVRTDALEVFMRLRDGKLPPDTFSGGTAPPQVVSDASAAATPGQPATNQPTQLDQPINVSWAGKLTVRPLKLEPAELERDHLFVRLTGEKSGPAKIEDTSVNATALAPTIEYGVTSRDLSMAGPPSNPVVLALAGSGAIRSPRVQLNVGTGRGTLAGEGQIASLANVTDPKKVDRMVKWKGLATIELATRNGWTNGQLRSAALAGGVTAISKSGLMTGQSLHLSFQPGASGREELRMVSVRDSVRVQAGLDAEGSDKGFMTADAIDITLEQAPGTNDPVPTHLLAQGDVSAGRAEQQLTAQWVSASLSRMTRTDSAGVSRADVEANVLHARGDVRFANGRNLQVRADTLDADVPKQLVFLEGKQVSIVRDSAKITGTDMQIDGLSRDLLVSGPGRFDYSRPAKGTSDNGGTVESTWTSALHVDDRTGLARAFGGARASASMNSDELDKLTAETLLIRFDARPDVATGKVDSTPRQFLGAEAYGSSAANTNAIVESRRFAPGHSPTSDPNTWQRLVRLESASIALDNAQGTLTVPQAGKLLVADRRPGGATPDAATSQGIGALQLSGSRGTTLFSWQGDMLMRKSAGSIDLRRQARMLHQPQGQQAPLILDADNMNALVMTSSGNSPDARAQLQRATCDGSVYLRSPDDQQTLSADALTFDAPTNTAQAESRSSNNVVLADKGKPSPLQARKLSWTLGPGGEIRIIEPASIVAPQ